MLNANETGRTHVIDPPQRVAEVLFGLIMVLTFTCSLSVADAGRDDVRAVLIGAVGCNLAWGIIDGIFYLMSSLAEKGSSLQKLLSLRGTTDTAASRQILASALPPTVVSVMQPDELDSISKRLRALPEPAAHAKLDRHDWLGGFGVLLIVFFSTFPVAVPFILMESVKPAMRTSNAVAIVLLFIAGYAYGRIVGRNPLLVGIGMVILGSSLVAMAIPLGG
jgi:VIT1/CCC1 family predicted Fe2+/Mn2+ transporter